MNRTVSPLRPRFTEYVCIEVYGDLFSRDEATLQRPLPLMITRLALPVRVGFFLKKFIPRSLSHSIMFHGKELREASIFIFVLNRFVILTQNLVRGLFLHVHLRRGLPPLVRIRKVLIWVAKMVVKVERILRRLDFRRVQVFYL